MKVSLRRVGSGIALLLALTLLCGYATAEEGRRGGRGGNRGRRPPRRERTYSVEQAISDRAQLHTLAFSGLAFLTGDFGASTFLPPGKVCDFFGFQYMRDVDEAGKGHNPIFLNRVAGNVLQILDEAQKQRFLDLAVEQTPQLDALARQRLPVIAAFHRQAEGKVPPRSGGLDREAAFAAVASIFRLDAELSLRRAEVMAEVAQSLTKEQKAHFASMKFGDFNTWPDVDARDARRKLRGRPHLVNVAYMTYASEFFSWTAGSLEADTYFCPERHATYFGGFYMKDMPAMGKRDYDISTSITGENGRTFVEEILDETQRKALTTVIEGQRANLKEIVSVRKRIAQELRKLLSGEAVDRQAVLELGERYGRLDGELSWQAAMAFSWISATLTEVQRERLHKLRNLEGYTSADYYIYSRPGKTTLDIEAGTKALFFAPRGS